MGDVIGGGYRTYHNHADDYRYSHPYPMSRRCGFRDTRVIIRTIIDAHDQGLLSRVTLNHTYGSVGLQISGHRHE